MYYIATVPLTQDKAFALFLMQRLCPIIQGNKHWLLPYKCTHRHIRGVPYDPKEAQKFSAEILKIPELPFDQSRANSHRFLLERYRSISKKYKL